MRRPAEQCGEKEDSARAEQSERRGALTRAALTPAAAQGEAQAYLAGCDCPEYLRKAERRLAEEKERCATYLDASSEPKILRVVEAELIQKQARSAFPCGRGAAWCLSAHPPLAHCPHGRRARAHRTGGLLCARTARVPAGPAALARAIACACCRVSEPAAAGGWGGRWGCG